MKRYESTKEQWERVKKLFPAKKTGKRGRPRKDDRNMLNGMLWIVRSGAQWREMPETYGPWQSVYARFAKWRDDGTLEAIFRALSADADMENLSLDSTCIKVHESANGGGKTADKAVGRTRGGLNTKLHTIVDGLENPVEFMLSAGNDHDPVHAVELLEVEAVHSGNGERSAKKIGRNSEEGCLGQVRQGYLYRAIREYNTENGCPIELSCALLHISRSAYHKWASGKLSNRTAENEQLAEKIEQIHQESPDKGYRRIRDELDHAWAPCK